MASPTPVQPVLNSLLTRIDSLQREVEGLHRTVEHRERLATLGTITGLLAHEFNNLLTPVRSYAQMALAAPDDRGLTTKALHNAANGAERAGQIAAAILAFVKDFDPAGGELNATGSPPLADVAAVVRDTLSCLGRDLSRDGIRLEIDIEPGCTAAILPVLLQHVLLNLFLNARAAMGPAGGSLRVSARHSAIRPQIPPDAVVGGSTWREDRTDGEWWATITVADTGKGIDSAALKSVFRAFYTAADESSDETAPGRNGTGLGMTVCQGLVRNTGGNIWLQSVRSRGTTVTVALPCVHT